MDPIRYGFMETIIQFVEGFVQKLPPLLQLILGVFVALGMFKVILIVANHFEKKRSDDGHG